MLIMLITSTVEVLSVRSAIWLREGDGGHV